MPIIQRAKTACSTSACARPRWRWAWGSAVLAYCAMVGAQTAPAPAWMLVQPLERIQAADVVAQHFARLLPPLLGEPVVVHGSTHRQEVEGVLWALNHAPRQRTLMLMSALLLTRLEDSGVNDMERRELVPLQMVLEGAWCLAAPSRQPLPNHGALQSWLGSLGRPVRIGLPGDYGTLRLWVKAMERKTGLRWQREGFTSSESAIQALSTGAFDLVMDRCRDVYRVLHAPAAPAESVPGQVLVRAGMTQDFSAPSFSDWKLPPMAPGWIAWFAPVGMPPKRQQALEQALHTVMQRKDTQKLLIATGRVPIKRTPQESRERVRQLQREWHQLQQWLDSTEDVH